MEPSREIGPDPLRILLVSEDPLSLEGLSALLAREPGLTEAGRCAPAAAHDLALSARPDVVLWDAGENGGSSFAEERPPIPVVTLSGGHVSVPELLAGGAQGCLSRQADSGTLAAALRAVAAGLHVLDAESARGLLPRPHPETDAPVESLTPREQEVLGLLSLGLTNRGIAERLRISEHTAKFHVNAVLSKLGAESRTEAVVKAARLGLVIL